MGLPGVYPGEPGIDEIGGGVRDNAGLARDNAIQAVKRTCTGGWDFNEGLL